MAMPLEPCAMPPICWFIGIGMSSAGIAWPGIGIAPPWSVDGGAPGAFCFAGIVMPWLDCVDFGAVWVTGFVVFVFLAAGFFFAPAFFVAGLGFIGMLMPGMFICATAGVAASESALAAISRRLNGMPSTRA